jgi:L-asparaginase II
MESPILAKVIRGETLESVHRGHLVVMDGSGEIHASIGNPDYLTFFRSAAKPFQALPLITSGGADRFGFTEDEIAIACASHSGEPIHVQTVARMLEKAGFTEGYLKCGTHLPFNDAEAKRMMKSGERATQLHNNCSGKHTAMLAFARHIGADPSSYDSFDNPIQQEILKTTAEFAELSIDEIRLGIDGCAAPNFAMPISAMARSFMNLINPPDSFADNVKRACRRIVFAMSNHPELIGGTERLDTIIMQASPGKLISKVGAEGVWLCAVLPNEKYTNGLAIALKIEDGDDRRGRPIVAVEILRQLRILSAGQLTEISPMAIKNRRGEIVGRAEASLSELEIKT